jgi:organic radical activating enzyme
VYTYFAENPKAVFKFVQTKEEDLEETLGLIRQYKIPANRVYLMPEGTSPEALKAKQLWLVEVCKQHGFNYTDRLHVHIYGPKRGV